MRTNILFKLLAVMVIVVLPLSACGKTSNSDVHVSVGELRVVPAEAASGQVVWIYIDKVEANVDVNYAWSANGESIEGQNTNGIQYQVPQGATDPILITVSITAQNYHQELTTLVNMTSGERNQITTPLPSLPPLSCNTEPLHAVITPYQGKVTGSGMVDYCQSVNGDFAAQVKFQGLPPGGSYVFTLQSGMGKQTRMTSLKKFSPISQIREIVTVIFRWV
jgi:hypothetical protein